MRWAFALMLLLAGCAAPSTSGPDDAATGPQMPAGNETVPETAGPAGAGAFGGAVDNATLDLAALDYDESFVRHVLRAEGPTAVRIVLDARLGAYANEDDCAVFAVEHHPVDAARNGSQAGLYAWAFHNNLHVEAGLEGQTTTVYEDGNDNSGQIPQEGGLAFNVTMQAGDALWLDMGGRSIAYATSHHQDPDAPSVFVQNRFVAEVEANRTFEWSAAPGGALRCGVGAWQAEGSTGAGAQVAEARTDGSVALATTAAATLIVMGEADHADGTVQFGDARIPLAPVSRSAGNATHMAVEFDRYVAAFPGIQWLMADADWPLPAA